MERPTSQVLRLPLGWLARRSPWCQRLRKRSLATKERLELALKVSESKPGRVLLGLDFDRVDLGARDVGGEQRSKQLLSDIVRFDEQRDSAVRRLVARLVIVVHHVVVVAVVSRVPVRRVGRVGARGSLSCVERVVAEAAFRLTELKVSLLIVGPVGRVGIVEEEFVVLRRRVDREWRRHG